MFNAVNKKNLSDIFWHCSVIHFDNSNELPRYRLKIFIIIQFVRKFFFFRLWTKEGLTEEEKNLAYEKIINSYSPLYKKLSANFENIFPNTNKKGVALLMDR